MRKKKIKKQGAGLRHEYFDIISIFGYQGLVTTEKLDREALPHGFVAYDLRDDGYGSICEIKDSISDESLWGTVILTEPIDGTDVGVEVDDYDYFFTGEQIRMSRLLNEFGEAKKTRW